MNTWGDHDFIENSRITCHINPAFGGDAHATLDTDGMRRKLAVVPHTQTVIGGVPGTLDPQLTTRLPGSLFTSTGTLHAAATAILPAQPLIIEMAEHLDVPAGRVLAQQQAHAISIPMVATPFKQNSFPVVRLHHRATGEAGGFTNAAGSGNSPIVTISNTSRFTDTIVLDGGVYLHLYSAFDAQGRSAGVRLRYRRIGDSGLTDTDVMLQPTQHVPH
jgi:hypothetical protein